MEESQLSGANNGVPVEISPTASANKKQDHVQMHLRRYEICTNESVVANPESVPIDNESRVDEKLVSRLHVLGKS